MAGRNLARRGHALISALDSRAGDGLEWAMVAHHRRRLTRLGHAQVLDANPATGLWARAAPPPRGGNAIRMLVDGEQALGEVANALRAARSFVHIAGWHITPEFRLDHAESTTLRDLLAELAERLEVRVLLWAGPPLPAFQPTRPAVRRARDTLTRGTRIRCALDSRERTMHCHHEKLVIVDGEVAFVGGIDLTSLGGDRWDRSEHGPRGELGWHDVAARLAGPIVADVAEHFRQRWEAVTDERLDASIVPDPAGTVALQLVRTLPERVYDFLPRGDFQILESYLRALRSAEHIVYLENQFLWSPELVAVMVDKLRHPPRDEFRILLVLPAQPNNGADTTRGQLGCLMEADAGAGRLLAVTINSHHEGRSEPLYVHAKVGIIDDRWLTVGSANLNEHSLFNDTEVNVVSCDAELARQTRLRLWAEHLQLAQREVDGDPAEVVDGVWRPIAEEQLRRRLAGEPLSHRLMRLPAVSHRAKRLLGPMRGLLVDG
ncbi:MAG: phospholipase D-like domain-containing protein [Candidatus Dormibacteria bacterium]